MYSVVKAAVRFNSDMSPCFVSDVGAKQGDPSSSLLFLFFVNDILENINENIDDIFTINEKKLFMFLFADDAILFAHSPQALQHLLDDLNHYCAIWGLKVNTSKTKIMIFEKGRHTSHNFLFNGIPLEIVKNIKYLGIYFFKNGHIHRSQQKIAQQAAYPLHDLFIVFNQLDLDTNEKVKLFDSLVGSILNYGAAIIGDHESKNIELLHCKFLRKILCVKKSTNLDALYGETGRYPMKIQRKIIMFKYWVKLINLADSSLLKSIYNLLKADADNDISYDNTNWAYRIKTQLNELGLNYLWEQQNEIDINLHTIRTRILDTYKQSWYSNINNSNRLASYCIYKHKFEMENYLQYITNNKYRIALTKFRLSSSDLKIETGRYENTPREERICPHCLYHIVEDEYHFLFTCPKYYELRRTYLKPFFCRWPTMRKFELLMNSKNKKELTNLSKYLYYAFRLRNEQPEQ
jgi:hypothetical protein